MPNQFKIEFLKQLEKRFGKPKRLPNSQSLLEIGDGLARIYVRYSKVHGGKRTFYGLRKEDLRQLEGFNSVLCFLWSDQAEPVFIPYADFEDIFNSLTPASDGQFKAQIYQDDGTELYIANAGRFNIEGYVGWQNLDALIDASRVVDLPDFSHAQIQTFLGSIGSLKGYDIWIPQNDRSKLDWSLAARFACRNEVPSPSELIANLVREIDVIWIPRGSSSFKALFEVEHSTPVYSGLLRFNDLHVLTPNPKPKFSIVSNDGRRSLFQRQINRPTFKISGLVEACNFLDYRDVFNWFNRIQRGPTS
jgi:hypothetical protein